MTAIASLPFEDYTELRGIHATALKDLLVSPLLYKYRRDHPRQDKDAFRVGRACHTAMLEPDRFPLEYSVWRKKQGIRRGRKWEAFCTANEGRTILTEAQYDTAIALRDSARSHAVASQLLAGPGRNELTVKWKHPRTGRDCVSRLDRLTKALVDVKTARDVSPRRFCADAAKFGYAMQLAFYADAVAVAFGETPPVKLLVGQNAAPFDVAVYDVPEDVLSFGRKQYEDALDLLAKCEESDKWPGQAPDEEVTLKLPLWAAPDFDEGGPDEAAPIGDADF